MHENINQRCGVLSLNDIEYIVFFTLCNLFINAFLQVLNLTYGRGTANRFRSRLNHVKGQTADPHYFSKLEENKKRNLKYDLVRTEVYKP